MARRGLNRAQFTPNVQDSNDLKGGGFQVLEDEKATRLKAAGSQRRPREQQTINFRTTSNLQGRLKLRGRLSRWVHGNWIALRSFRPWCRAVIFLWQPPAIRSWHLAAICLWCLTTAHRL